MAAPTSSHLAVRGEAGGVQVLPTNVTGADTDAFPAAPSDLEQGQRDFLSKYQALSEAAFQAVAPVRDNSFSAAGFCYSDFPCLSVNKAAVATIGDKQEVEKEQVAAILDQLTSTDTVTFDHVNGSPFSGLKITKNGAVLDVIAQPGTMESEALGGMAFDMFKLQSDDISTNSIRATQAKTDGQERPLLALCLYPEGADATQTYNFCIGKGLDGKAPDRSSSKRTLSRREGGLSDLLCSFIDIPLIC